jgi:hypothetical protein
VSCQLKAAKIASLKEVEDRAKLRPVKAAPAATKRAKTKSKISSVLSSDSDECDLPEPEELVDEQDVETEGEEQEDVVPWHVSSSSSSSAAAAAMACPAPKN